MPTFIRARRASIHARDSSIRGQTNMRSTPIVAMGANRMGMGNARSIPSRPALGGDVGMMTAPMPMRMSTPVGSPYLLEGPVPAASKLAEVRGKLARCERERGRLEFLLAQLRLFLDNDEIEAARNALRSMDATP